METLQRVLDFPVFRFGEGEVTVVAILKLIGWIVAVVILERLLRTRVITRALKHTPLPPGSQFGIARVFGYAFVALGIYLGLQFAGINTSSLTIFAGALGVGIGFGLQNIISNFVSGIIILLERPINLGDRIEIGDAAGRVDKISLRSTVVVTGDNISIIVPNSDLITDQVTNWSYGDPKVRLRIPFGVAYGSDLEKLQKVIGEVAVSHPEALRDPAPHLFFSGFGESSLDFELAVWTRTMADRPRRMRSDINFGIERALRENGFEMPFPQRDMNLSGQLEIRRAGNRKPTTGDAPESPPS